ncbi:hypothetical protein [Fodinicola feengrottensis]|nr:hypothetical protein [Fodinicola feengrottensis]
MLSGQVGKLAAQARWGGCPSTAGILAASQTNLLDVKVLSLTGSALPIPVGNPLNGLLPKGVLPIGGGVPLVSGTTGTTGSGVTAADAPAVAYTDSRGGLVTVSGQKGLGVTSQATLGLADLQLFAGTPAQTTLRLTSPSPAKLTATAGGANGKSSVSYSAPALTVTGPDGKAQTIATPGKTVEIGLAGLAGLPGLQNVGLPGLLQPLGNLGGVVPGSTSPLPDISKAYLAKITIGDLSDQQDSPTVASGRLSMLRLDLLSLDGVTPLVSIALGDLSAHAEPPPAAALSASRSPPPPPRRRSRTPAPAAPSRSPAPRSPSSCWPPAPWSCSAGSRWSSPPAGPSPSFLSNSPLRRLSRTGAVA